MYKTAKRCFVVGCVYPDKTLHSMPTSEKDKKLWMDFIYNGNVPEYQNKCMVVCSKHFTADLFINLSQVKSGFGTKLRLKTGSIPTIRNTNSEPASTSEDISHIPRIKVDAACQTDPPPQRSVRTQLSWRTLRTPSRSIAVQAQASHRNVGVGTKTFPLEAPLPDLPPDPIERPSERSSVDSEEEDEDPFEGIPTMEIDDSQDPTYDPTESIADDTETTDMLVQAPKPPHKINTYIVYETCLMELFEVCPVCRRVCDVQTTKMGTFISVQQLCPHCQFARHWNSQPILGSTPAGNLQLSAATYVNGLSFYKLGKVFKAMNMQLFKYNTFRRHARMFIEPAVVSYWKTSQEDMLRKLREEDKVLVGGDMKAVSPGTKFGSYTLMDLKNNKVVDLQLVQSNEAGGSTHMEREGLKRSLEWLKERGVTPDCIVTDRHRHIQEFLRESSVTQLYDVGHIEKGISKQLLKAAKKRDCEQLRAWLKSIRKHIYWTAATSTTGPERVAKWTSILNHVQGHEDPLFPKGLHPLPVTRDKGQWLAAGTQAFHKLEKVLSNERVLNDVEKLSPHHQTSPLKAFHSAILRFAPQHVVFPFLGMLCRLYLAAIHYNERAERPTSSTGDPPYELQTPEAREGECRAKAVKTDPTFRYVDNLMDLIFDQVFVDPAPFTEEVLKIPVPEDLTGRRSAQNMLRGSILTAF
ncbi:uncharacterized protein [Pseudochaenichthys georgianus]|uniref:uncharacterized protein n=1 Tax=Pseudochaenichthys georgianus TaxID=52239 RepID=UPI00146C0FB2|nr:uncharacterized protein LOC117461579 [Pseudochaenichthys georgianus]